MKKCSLALVVSIVLGFIISINIPASLITTLFTVVGVMFSVGMSLVVTMSTQNIHNPDAKKMVQSTINSLLRNYIFCFVILTICFAIALLFKVENNDAFKDCEFNLFNRQWGFNYPLVVAAYSVYSIIYYIFNMSATRNQNYKIQCQIDAEQSEE